jgi:hypothetical protein
VDGLDLVEASLGLQIAVDELFGGLSGEYRCKRGGEQ